MEQGAHASRVRVRASRPNHWLNHSVWETGFRRDAENGNRDGRAPHSECRTGNGARGSPREIRRRQWEALAWGIISQGETHDAGR